MKKIRLYIGENSILGMDSIMYIDGRFNLCSIKNKVNERNESYKKNFPHKVCTGFRFCDERLNETGSIINL